MEVFNHNDIQLKFFKQQFDPEVKEKERRNFESRKIFNPFNKNKINKSLKHINDEMEKSAEKFYSKKEKDDDLSLL